VLVHNAINETYVAERNLEPDGTEDPVSHPLIDALFTGFMDGRYIGADRGN